MDIESKLIESKLSDVTVTPIPRSQVQNFYNYQQQREQREQQPQIQISAIRSGNNSSSSSSTTTNSSSNDAAVAAAAISLFAKSNGSNELQQQQLQQYRQLANLTAENMSTAALALQYQQLQAQLAQLATTATATAKRQTSGQATPTSKSSNGNGNSGSANNQIAIDLVQQAQSLLKYPQSTSPLISNTQISSTASLPPLVGGNSTPTSNGINGVSKYAQLLAVIEEMGRDIRPTYTGSRSSTERLKRGIVQARVLVRECLMETERSARQ